VAIVSETDERIEGAVQTSERDKARSRVVEVAAVRPHPGVLRPAAGVPVAGAAGARRKASREVVEGRVLVKDVEAREEAIAHTRRMARFEVRPDADALLGELLALFLEQADSEDRALLDRLHRQRLRAHPARTGDLVREHELSPRPTRSLDGKLRWESVGPPNASGCVRQIALDPSDHRRLYAAAHNGGLWVLDDVTRYPASKWVPLTDENVSLQTESFAIAAADPACLYLAQGAWSRQRIYRSRDRGRTWELTCEQSFDSVRKILVHPDVPEVVYLATWEGLYRSSRGGVAGPDPATEPAWIRALPGRVVDAILDPEQPGIVYAARIASRAGGGEQLELHRSMNRGVTWPDAPLFADAVDPAQNPSTMIRIALGGRNGPHHRSVAVKAGVKVFYNRTRGGAGNPRIEERAFRYLGRPNWGGYCNNDGYNHWCHVLAIDPFDDDVILAGGQELFRTTNAGVASGEASWTFVPNTHWDLQSIVFDDQQQGLVYLANDGGVATSLNNGRSFGPSEPPGRNLSRGLITTELSRVGFSGERMLGSVMHYGLMGTQAAGSGGDWDVMEGGWTEWLPVHGDPLRPQFFYVLADRLLRRRIPANPQQPQADCFYGIAAGIDAAGGFTPTALAVDPRPSTTRLIVGAKKRCGAGTGVCVMMTNDAGLDHVEPASGNGELAPAMTWRQDGAFLPWDDDEITCFALSPGRPGLAYAGTRNGRVYRKDDIGAAGDWIHVGDAGHPIRGLVVHPEVHTRLFATSEWHILRSNAGGATGSWAFVEGGGEHALPRASSENLYHGLCIPRGDRLFVGSQVGVFVSDDEGERWYTIDPGGIPNAVIKQLFWQGDALYAVTYGRGVWRTRSEAVVSAGPAGARPDILRDLGDVQELLRGRLRAPIPRSVGRAILSYLLD
jgi:hypothetical protein